MPTMTHCLHDAINQLNRLVGAAVAEESAISRRSPPAAPAPAPGRQPVAVA